MPSRSRVVLPAALLAMLLPAGAEAAAVGDVPGLAAHRAVYEITLDKSKGGGVSDLTGRMVYELTGNACLGYTQTMRFVTRMTSGEGEPQISDLRSTTEEDAAMRVFKFSSSQYRDDQLAEQTTGSAKREGDAGPIKVEVEKPKKATLDVAASALFPVQHSLALLAAARAGKSIYASDLYDGSEKGEKVYATTAVIGAKVPPGKNPKLPSVPNAEKLEQYAAWPVSLSYFDVKGDKADAAPSYELAFLFFENGVSQRLFIDYGEFSIRGALKDLVFLDTPACDKKP